MEIKINTIDMQHAAAMLKAGQRVLLSGTVYTARDAAHKRLCSAIENNMPLPFELKNATVYYAGPTPTPPGRVIGSCGPTTSSRMDFFTPTLLRHGLKAMVGKGKRSPEVVREIAKNGAVYLCALGGAGALAARCIESASVIAYEDLGCESIKKLVFKNFPLIVGVDSTGENILF